MLDAGYIIRITSPFLQAGIQKPAPSIFSITVLHGVIKKFCHKKHKIYTQVTIQV